MTNTPAEDQENASPGEPVPAGSQEAAPAGSQESAPSPSTDPDDRPYLPWRGKATRTDKALAGTILGIVLLMLALWPLRPFLIAQAPVALAFVTGSKAATGAVAAFASVGRYPLWLALVAGTVGMAKFDWLFWWTGRQWGQGIVNMFAQGDRAKRFAAQAHGFNPWILRGAVLLAVLPGVPSALVYALAGWTGMRLGTFLVFNVLGSLGMASVVVAAGYSSGEAGVELITAIDSYALWISLAIIFAMAYLGAKKAGKSAQAAQGASGGTPSTTQESD
ncbi:VTT domain-containing protein [Nocardiopsis sp. RSe5-2]|uniref:VTT domain-containing protein n=1 Tax=Nocardiopsis endophytica TaxID=3018445 RepID=A0ABT4U358_9ACTN|nr:VTT domain-containing protein [Nocardiopsis endophytica]MDA2811131.1 VTT domain-containing protein [Nocardiopsis endophytica]